MAELTHPALPGVTITVPDKSAWVRIRNGWKNAAEPVVDEVAPDLEDAPELDELAPEPDTYEFQKEG